jgi:hypothetical protein
MNAQTKSKPKTKYILACVDGTDSAKWRADNTLGGTRPANYSHVKQVYDQFDVQGGVRIPYEDGPELNGSGSQGKVSSITRSITDFVKNARSNGSNFRPRIAEQQCSMDTPKYDYEIVLFGHSRGAVICGDVASKLKSLNIGVYFLGLFDAVNRAYSLDGGSSTNVMFTYHARRDPSATRMTIARSRVSFGSDLENSLNNYHQAYFQTSHGGVGGSPALDYDQLGVGDDLSCAGISKNRTTSLKLMEKYMNSRTIYSPYGGGASGDLSLHVAIQKAWIKKGSAVSALCVQQSQASFDWMVANARSHGLPL